MLMRGALPRLHLRERYLRKDGSPLQVSLSVGVVRDPAGEPIGGDELVMLLEGPVSSVQPAMQRLTRALGERNAARPTGALLAASLGLVEVNPTGPDTLEQVVARADAAMYANKRAQRANR